MKGEVDWRISFFFSQWKYKWDNPFEVTKLLKEWQHTLFYSLIEYWTFSVYQEWCWKDGEILLDRIFLEVS